METRPSVDDLRARLRDLGYLDAGVDRFVLAPARSGRGATSLAWRSSARIGLLAGLLLGPSAAVALGIRLPGLLTGPRDAIVLGLYLACLFGSALTLVAFAATWALGRLAIRTRPRGVARMAGALVAVACLVYLVLWWRTVDPSAWGSLVWTASVLVAVVAISMLLGHAVMMATLAYVARGAGDATSTLRRSAASWRLTIALGALAFAVGAGLLFVVPHGDGVSTLPPARAPRASRTGLALTVVAIDGLDLRFLDRMRADGRTPRLARLLGGARLELPASDAPDPARTWTSLATGQPADVHGIRGLETRRVTGIEGTMPAPGTGLGGVIGAATDLLRLTRPALTTGLQRRSKTFWEISAEAGLRTLVVNWWASWPAPDGPGVVLTERATLRLERRGPLDAEVAPSAVYPRLLEAWPALRDEVRRRVMAAFPDSTADDVTLLRRAAEQDAVQIELTLRLETSADDLRAIYLPGLDIVQHAMLGAGGGASLPASVLAARVDLLARYYAFLDHELAPLVDPVRPGGVTVVLADPGRSAPGGRGGLVLVGGPARAGVIGNGDIADVVPTLLYAMGVPISRELAGRCRLELFEPAFVAAHPVRVVSSYGPRVIGRRPPAAVPLDQEMVDRLRSLGYVR